MCILNDDKACPWNFSICTMPCLKDNEEERNKSIELSRKLSLGIEK